MATRIITATISSNESLDLAGGRYAGFTVTSDTGADATGIVTAARLHVSSLKCYATSAYLDIVYHSTGHATLAHTGALSGDSSTHAEDFVLTVLDNALLSATPATMYLLVVATSGSSSKVNFREGCTITLEIDYMQPPTKCTPPGNVRLSSATSSGEVVRLSWTAGSDGNNNAVAYYEIAYHESTDGITWQYPVALATTTALEVYVTPPPTIGNYYLYAIRTVGVMGAEYASEWVYSSSALQNPPIGACIAPSGVMLASSTSTGEGVTLTWNAGGGGAHNAALHYEIGFKESADGITWGDMSILVTTTLLYCGVPAPLKYGHYYRYYVRMVGELGAAYASMWVASKNTLQHVRPALVAYTDDPVAAGVTRIKAAHVLELRTNIDRLRQGLGIAPYAFTEIRAGYTSLARWRGHILELRAAVDEIAPAHEVWLDIPANRPTAAVVQQLRRVVAAI